MTQRRAGQRLRIQARHRRNEVLRDLGSRLAVGALVWWSVVALIAVAMYPFLGRDGVLFIAGVSTGAFAVMALMTFQYVDPVGARLYSGIDGETSTAHELRKLHRSGWRAVHNVHFRDHGDVDHVAVGPGGVVVIETKTSNADWGYLQRQGLTDQWTSQAKRGVVRIKGLTKQYADVTVEPTPLLVAWVPEQPDEPSQMPNGVTRVDGAKLRQYLTGLPSVLDSAEIRSIVDGLEAASRTFDKAAGVKHPGRIRRMLEAPRVW